MFCWQGLRLTPVSHSKFDTSVSNDLHPNTLPHCFLLPAIHHGKLAKMTRCEGLAPSITPRRKQCGSCHTILDTRFTFNAFISVRECQKQQGDLKSSTQFAKSSLCHKSLIPEFQHRRPLSVGLNIYTTQQGFTVSTGGAAQFNTMSGSVITLLLMTIDLTDIQATESCQAEAQL